MQFEIVTESVGSTDTSFPSYMLPVLVSTDTHISIASKEAESEPLWSFNFSLQILAIESQN